MQGKARNNAFSYARAVACVAIVVLHTVLGAVSLFPDAASTAQRAASNAVVNNMMWAVPVFLMVSGALLLDPAKTISIEKIFRKYIFRVVVALLVFSLLFRVLEIFANQEPLTAEAVLSGFTEFFTAGSWSHLWYLYLLVGLYLLLPFYKKIAAHSSNKELLYLLGVYVVFLSLLPILRIWDAQTGFYICTSTIYPFYFFCGHALHRGALRVSRTAAVVLVVLGTAGVTGFTLLHELGGVDGINMLYNYSSIFVIFQAVGLFSLFSRTAKAEEPKAFGKLLLQLDACSFGIYLIHMIFVRGILKHTAIEPFGPWSIPILIGLVLGITAVSFLITWLLKKLPGVRQIL